MFLSPPSAFTPALTLQLRFHRFGFWVSCDSVLSGFRFQDLTNVPSSAFSVGAQRGRRG